MLEPEEGTLAYDNDISSDEIYEPQEVIDTTDYANHQLSAQERAFFDAIDVHSKTNWNYYPTPENPNDPTPMLIYADWLEEEGNQPDLAEIMRLDAQKYILKKPLTPQQENRAEELKQRHPEWGDADRYHVWW